MYKMHVINNMHLLETGLKKEKLNLLGLVKPQQKDIWRFQDLS